MNKSPSPSLDTAETVEREMERILQEMLDADEDLTARGIIRRHSRLKAASSITRSPERVEILARYKTRQEEFRRWRQRLARRSKDVSAMSLADKDIRIAELEQQVSLLTYSHVAMIRAVGELGGMAKWSKFFEDYKAVRDELNKMGALPSASITGLDAGR